MPILGDATIAFALLTRSTSNALRVQLTSPDGTELAHAQQKAGAAVLLGYKNGGKSNYMLSNTAGDELRIAVARTTTITKQNTPVGKIVPADGAARFETGDGTTLAVIQPHTGSKTDSAWHHRILSSADDELGVLTLMRAQNGWSGIAAETTLWLLNQNVGALKPPSAGVLLKLGAPVAPELGDVLAAACIDFSVLPRGYIA
jgi:antitoxin (DNA-binding transcriptional repressor) of toxin-antitoxin stability system